MKANMASCDDNNPAAAEQREALRKAIAFKSYEFNCHGVEMNQRYESSAIVPDGAAEPEWKRDRELYYQASTRPGAHLPHVWLFDKDNREVSTLDLAGKGRFTVFTGIGGEAWADAARRSRPRPVSTSSPMSSGRAGTIRTMPATGQRRGRSARRAASSSVPTSSSPIATQLTVGDAKAKLTAALAAVLGKPLSAERETVGAGNSRQSDW